MEYNEYSAKTVSDCITEACLSLSVPSDKLDYEVVSEGTSGFMGIGAKPAVIKARIKEESEKIVSEDSSKVEEKTEIKKENKINDFSSKDYNKDTKISGKKNVSKKNKQDNYDSSLAKKENEEISKKPVKVIDPQVIDTMKSEAEKFLKDVFLAMKLSADINCNYDSADNTLNINIEGDDMGVLIGRRGQTLDSLQYLVSLVINKGTSEYVRVKVDTENYRARRKDTLENLARNMAFKVKRTRRSASLEPMNPYERRIIHSALQNDRYVTTHSEGEEPFRKVIITLKR